MRWDCRSSRASAFASICERAVAIGAACGLAAACLPEADPPQRMPEWPEPTEPPDGPRAATISHAIAPSTLAPGEERIDCYSWTLGNEQPLYVQGVSFANAGSFHHSNWFVVPEEVYDGPDGPWDCASRGFDQFAAVQTGTVLFAQSTQAWEESMDLAEGAVIRIPERSRILAEVHLLNLAPETRDTAAWLGLDLIHPWDVVTVLSPLQLTYYDLQIPAKSRVRFTGACPGPAVATPPMDIYYVLPHYHATGDFFKLEVVGITEDEAQEVMRIEGFDADVLGRTFDPPVHVETAHRLRFTCGYDNIHDRPLTWGIGIDEMCVVLALVDAAEVTSSVVFESEGFFTIEDGVPVNGGPCETFVAPKGLAYAYPTSEERAAPLYLPPNVDAVDTPLMPLTCVDADPTVAPSAEPTLDNVRAGVLEPSCTFSACHGDAKAAGLQLNVSGLRQALLEHEVQAGTDLPLLAPGDPEGSWLYRIVSRCEPGVGATHMPRNAPVLLPDATVALLREWIAAGAPE